MSIKLKVQSRRIYLVRTETVVVRRCASPGGGPPLGILVGGVPPGSPNPDPISYQKI